MLALPFDRLRQAGASAEEVAALEETFERSDVLVQQSWVDELKAMSRAGLRIYVEDLRESGFYDQVGRYGASSALSAPHPTVGYIGALDDETAPNGEPEPVPEDAEAD